jgi:hypothetical protein
MLKRLILVSMLLVLMISSAYSFDNNRKGFVLGGGVGFAPVAKWEVDNLTIIDDSNTGFGLNLVIGYAWDENNMIVYEGNVVGFKSVSINIVQGFNGAAWYHYFGPTGKTFFSTAGLGVYIFDPEDLKQNDLGGAILLGGGYEFSPHWQVGAYLSAGKTKDPDFSAISYNHVNFSILISGVAF